jgi:hypothetical protein
MSTQATEVFKAVMAFLLGGIGATIIFVMPGYLLGVAYGRGIRGPAPSERAFIANAAVGTIVVHLLMLPWTVPLATAVVRHGPAGYVFQIALWTGVVLIVVPTLLGAAVALLGEVRSPDWLHRLLGRVGLSSVTRIAGAWNWVFSRGFPAYVRVRLSDGRTVLGLFSDRSFASSDAAVPDLYLEQQWSPIRAGSRSRIPAA